MSTEPPVESKPTDAPFAFAGLLVRQLHFQELPINKLEPTEAPKGSTRIKVEMEFAVRIPDDGSFGDVRAKAKVTGDISKPYLVRVDIVGRFSSRSGNRDELAQFCRRSGPVILFPFVRSHVHQLTTNGRLGPILLDLMNLQSVIADDAWREGSERAKDQTQDAAEQSPDRP